MSIQVGDAVLKFIGDTSNMDAAFDSVGDKATKGLKPATEALDDVQDGFNDAGKAGEKAADSIEDAGKRTSSSMRDARGEVALLGEEFGIRLPRHVRNFLAEMPGVSGALSAAFSATAVLFLIQALSEATEKVSNFVGGWLIYTQAMKEQQALLVAENVQIAKQADLYNKAKDSLQALTDTRTPAQKLNDILKAQNDEMDRLAFKTGEYARTTQSEDQARVRALQEQIALTNAQIEAQAKADKDKNSADTLKSLRAEIELHKQLATVQVSAAEAVNGLSKENADEVRYQISIKALHALAAAEKEYGKDNEDTIKKTYADIQQATVEHTLKLSEELKKQQDALETTMNDIQKDVKASNGIEIITPANVERLYAGVEAVRALGITLRSDLVQKLNEAKLAEEEFAASGIKDAVALKALQAEVKKAQEAIDDYGITMDKTKAKSELTWKSIVQDWHNGANAAHATTELASQAFNQISSAITAAFTAAILGQKGFGAALEQATKQAIASLGAQALVKALFYTAEGVAALAMGLLGNPSAGAAAGQYFLAAGEMAAIGGTAAGLARALPGGGSGSGNGPAGGNYTNNSTGYQYNGGQSNTSGQAGSGRSTVGVQAFADGGLVMSPTLALIGERGREAVIPLDDPQAKQQIGDGIGGGATHNYFHIQGVISDDTLAKVVSKINAKVARGQLNLNSSSTFKITKRGG